MTPPVSRGHNAASLAEARRLRELGWEVTDISSLLGVPYQTVYRWLTTPDEEDEARRAKAYALNQRMLELRQRGLSYTAISIVLDEYHDVQLTDAGVRHRCIRQGASTNPSKTRGHLFGQPA